MKNSPKNMVADTLSDMLSASETMYAAELEAIGSRIGYGRSCQILGYLWDQMLEREYGVPAGRGKMERRRDIETIEAAIAHATQPAAMDEAAERVRQWLDGPHTAATSQEADAIRTILARAALAAPAAVQIDASAAQTRMDAASKPLSAIAPQAAELPAMSQVPVATYLAPDGKTHWPAYSHEQRQEYARSALALRQPQGELVQLRAQNMLLVGLYDAVAKLVKAKGRYHTEQNYREVVAAYDLARTADDVPPAAAKQAGKEGAL